MQKRTKLLPLPAVFAACRFPPAGSDRFWGAVRESLSLVILPLFVGGALVAGFPLGGPRGSERGIIPNPWIGQAVEGSLCANFFASFVAAFKYCATRAEAPILEGLIKSGMAKGPALALSPPNMPVIRSVMGNEKTIVFISPVIVLSTIAGMAYGALF